MKHNITLVVFSLLCVFHQPVLAQVKIGNNPSTINVNSLLELESTTKGLLLPRMTNLQIAAMTGVPTGMLIFSSTDSALYLRRDTGWAVLSLGAQNTVTSKWATSGNDIYNTNSGKVGIGTSAPYSQLANNSNNTIGSEGSGGNPGSISWASTQAGYVGQIYNGSTAGNAHGMIVKTNSTTAIALEVSQGAQSVSANPLLVVKSNGNIGIGTNAPAAKLDVKGDIRYSGNLQMGVQYNIFNGLFPATYYATGVIGCPEGTKLIGGGGGSTQFDVANHDFRISYSGPDPDNPAQWRLTGSNVNTVAIPVSIYAICAKVQ